MSSFSIGTPQVSYFWDFDFQGRFEVDVPDDQKPFLALAGSVLHGDFYTQLAACFKKQAAHELRRKKDFQKRDAGFSLNRSIRDAAGNLIRVYDRKYKKLTLAMPDVVDYRNDVIIDLKTYFIFEPPEEGGILVTVDTVPKAVPCGDASPETVNIPDGYQDSWRELKELIEGKIGRKYANQFDRYREAYLSATGRTPLIKVFVVLYTKTYGYTHDMGYGGMRKLPNE